MCLRDLSNNGQKDWTRSLQHSQTYIFDVLLSCSCKVWCRICDCQVFFCLNNPHPATVFWSMLSATYSKNFPVTKGEASLLKKSATFYQTDLPRSRIMRIRGTFDHHLRRSNQNPLSFSLIDSFPDSSNFSLLIFSTNIVFRKCCNP